MSLLTLSLAATLSGQGLQLSINGTRALQFLEAATVTVVVRNAGSEPVTALSLDDAGVQLDLSGEHGTAKRFFGGAPNFQCVDQGGMRVYLAVPLPKPATLQPGRSWTREIRLVDAWNNLFLHGGVYRVKARYRDLEAEAGFEVAFDPKRDMPRLIDLYEKSPVAERQIPAGYLYNLTRDKEFWNTDIRDDRAVKAAAKRLRDR